MGDIFLVTGGVRSGKSTFAEEMASHLGDKIAYIATNCWQDAEIHQRIEIHRARRPKTWVTYELCGDNHLDLGEIIAQTGAGDYDGILIDCIGMWLSSKIIDNAQTDKILDLVKEFCQVSLEIPQPVIMVTNEVGLSLVPPNEMGRKFQDLLGKTNAMIGDVSKEVYFNICGFPLEIKGLGREYRAKWGIKNG